MRTTASRHTSLMSDPVYPSSLSATWVRLTSGARRFLARETRSTASRVARSGKSTRMRRGSRRRTASSRSKGRLVEAMTTTRSLVVRRPSHSCISVVFTDVRVPCEDSSPPSRLLRIESTSSMYTTQGARRRARVKTARAFFSDSPSHLFSMDEASTLKKVAPPSVATALASMVLPVPGGPKSKTPLTASAAMPSLYRCGYLSG
mmetsp:Transcript_46420/g.104849  ORF Transcript_46420/g.104849 Transcript_46420/m.104849 type:complete len:204 (+) Transcript_46420:818-1429(+)